MNDPAAFQAIDVIFVNYRTGPLVVSCLESLASEVEERLRIRAFIVDNASPDDSAAGIETAIAENGWHWARLIRSPENGGFGAGNNLGIAAALAEEQPADLVWLLNPDTRVMPGAARELAGFMERTPQAALVGTALLEADGRPWPYAFRFPSILGEIERGLRWHLASRLLARHAIARSMGPQPQSVDWVSGASLAIRPAILRKGLRFDESYFLYYEETDLCRAAQADGWACWYLPQAVVLHISGQSTGVTDTRAAPRRMPAYWFESRRRYFRKNHGLGYAMVADLAWMVSHAVFRLKQLFRRQPTVDPPRLLRDFARYSSLVPRKQRQPR